MSGIFTSTPGYAGYYGPITGNNVIVKFGRAQLAANVTVDAIARQARNSIDTGFLADSYTIDWNRPAASKRFLNHNQPVAIVGYGSGTVTFTGLIGTYQGFENISGGSTGSGTYSDVCEPLLCVISSADTYQDCNFSGPKGDGIDWVCYNMLLSRINITGRVEDNGNLFQQGTLVFTLGGLAPKKA